jgi:hypothetical protein
MVHMVLVFAVTLTGAFGVETDVRPALVAAMDALGEREKFIGWLNAMSVPLSMSHRHHQVLDWR